MPELSNSPSTNNVLIRRARITSIEMKKGSTEDGDPFFISIMARPERFELPTTWFVARYSIQLSYGRVAQFEGRRSYHNRFEGREQR